LTTEYLGNQIKAGEMGGTGSMPERDEKFMPFKWKNGRKETI